MFPAASLPVAFVFSVVPFVEKYLEITREISAWAPESELRSSLDDLQTSKSSFSANIEKQQEVLHIIQIELENIRKKTRSQGNPFSNNINEHNLRYFEKLIREESEQIKKLEKLNEELNDIDLSIDHTEKDLKHIVEASESFKELISQFFRQAQQIPIQDSQLEQSKEDIRKSIKK
ncbi:hypothetical protein HK096_002009, partial [Nowakowskiella sp. JEL0078]